MQKFTGADLLKTSALSTIAAVVILSTIATTPANSACLFCSGGAFSIDKPFDEGGALSIDKPLDKGGALSIDKPFDKGGALSIDKPFDKGGALSIDKPLDKGGALSIDKPFDKGGALSIDKPFDKGGALSIDKPFDGDLAKGVGRFGTDAWNAVKRPFVETWKFLSDPFAGLKRGASDLLDRAMELATSLAKNIVVWLGIGLAAVLAFAISLAMGFAALILSRSRRGAVKSDLAR